MDCANIHETAAWARLQDQAAHVKSNTHLRELLKDEKRCEGLVAEHDGILLDYSRQCVTQETMVQCRNCNAVQTKRSMCSLLIAFIAM
jgi:hypothetical protein